MTIPTGYLNESGTLAPTWSVGGLLTLDTSAITPSAYSWVLPATNGTAGYVLSNDGAGNLSWVAQGSGSSVSVFVGDEDCGNIADPASSAKDMGPINVQPTSNINVSYSAPIYLEYLTSNYTNATSSATNIFDGITTLANHIYLVEFGTNIGNSVGSSGCEIQITAPAGSTVNSIYLHGTTSAGYTQLTSINTLQAFSTGSGNNTGPQGWAVVTTSTTTGNLTLGGATTIATMTAYAGSWIRITDLTLSDAIQS